MKPRFLWIMVLAAVFIAGMTNAASTPPKGSAERREILAALRQELKTWTKLDVIFVVKYLKVKDGWAWVTAFPESPDGKSKYEPVEALLHKKAGAWQVMEMRPGGAECEEDPDCADDTRYFRKLKDRFPAVNAEIFPH
ncbi:MAG: hypothetical protein QME75_02310 [Deltaproteobacteria bacterium]|nr:hypothetical protein [Deltaproteobacteria bacterium]